ncbi:MULTISPECIES: TetR/AcrR family transcriptional regulator [Agromyces]|jgi:AcrR family transcriptional regulator|uniref:TetR/AcrR family transcriptional regulator n=1 Tax=Agromyces TaxID=33877 RepID=UPI001E4D709B|nr:MULTISPECIES: TetR/AcrR family transcriptional regulator [Agromyces]MCD1572430.1 TetR family transcriptional regulator [Agromyces mediolanus]GLU88341.1 hypothetical protein Agsp01_05960 [Agromyces sp. NBRC 114283]
MPIEVDESERLAEIADATVAVANERGTRAVTLRAVAERLGRSTAFITNFVPSRAHLMVNALEHAQSHWRTERASLLRDATGIERLVAVARWMCSTTPEDNVLRSLWVEVIGDVRGDTRRAYDVVREVTDATYQEFVSSAEATDLEHPEYIADILYLYCRGFHVKTVEDPEAWTDERVNASLEVLLRALLGPRLDALAG